MAIGGTVNAIELEIRATDNTADGLTSAQANLKATGEQMARQGKQMMVAGAAVVGALGLAAKAAMDFENQMAYVSTVLDDTNQGILPEFSAGVIALSNAIGKSAADLAGGLYDVMSSGIAAKDAMAVLGVGARAGVAGLTDAKTATSVIVAALNAYGLSADQASQVADTLFSTVNYGVVTFEELANSIGTVMPFARSAGVELDQLGAMIATLTLGGVGAHEAMTYLRGMFNSFAGKAGPDAAAAFNRLGIAQNSSALRGEELFVTMGKLRGATEEEIATIFGNVRARSAIIGLIDKQAQYQKIANHIAGDANVSQEAFNKITATASFQWGVMRESMRNTAIIIGGTLLPAVYPLLKMMAAFFGVIQKIPTPILAIGAALTSIVGGILLAAGAVRFMHGQIVRTYADIIKAIPSIRAYWLAHVKGAGSATMAALPWIAATAALVILWGKLVALKEIWAGERKSLDISKQLDDIRELERSGQITRAEAGKRGAAIMTGAPDMGEGFGAFGGDAGRFLSRISQMMAPPTGATKTTDTGRSINFNASYIKEEDLDAIALDANQMALAAGL